MSHVVDKRSLNVMFVCQLMVLIEYEYAPLYIVSSIECQYVHCTLLNVL